MSHSLWSMNFHCGNGKPVALVHYVALIGNHSIVRITHCRWRYCLIVTQRPLSLSLSITYQWLLYMTYHCYCLRRINFKGVREKTDSTEIDFTFLIIITIFELFKTLPRVIFISR